MKISKKILAVLLAAAMLLSLLHVLLQRAMKAELITLSATLTQASISTPIISIRPTFTATRSSATAATPCPKWSSATMSWASISWR